MFRFPFLKSAPISERGRRSIGSGMSVCSGWVQDGPRAIVINDNVYRFAVGSSCR